MRKYLDNTWIGIIFSIFIVFNFIVIVTVVHDWRGFSWDFVWFYLFVSFVLLLLASPKIIDVHNEYVDECNAQLAQNVESDKKRLEEEENKFNYFAEHYYLKFQKLHEILKRIPDDYPDPGAFEIMDTLKKSGMNLEPKPDEKPYDIFIASIRHHNIDNLFEAARAIFDTPRYNFNQKLEKSVLTYLVHKSAFNGRHVYGLPDLEYSHDQDSPDENDYTIKPSDRFKHAYILGKTGAGKTTLLQNLITQDISRGHGVIVISPEGALFDFIVKDFPFSRLDKLILFDPTDDSPPLVSLNPLHLEDRRDLAREAGAVAGTLGRAMGDDLSGAMQTLLLKCAYTLLQLPNSSFQDVRELLKPVSPLRATLATHPDLDDITREYWRDEFDKGGHKRSAEALISRLDAFFMPPLASTLSRASFSLTDALNASRSVFLFDFSRIHGTQQTIIGQLTLSLILQTLLKREAQPENKRIPYHLYIDEFQTFAENSETAFREMLNRARKYKMSVTLAHQVSSDIPPRLLDTILGNVGTKVCLQLATTDAEFFAKQMHVAGYSPHEAAHKLERLKVGEGYLSTPSPNQFNALKITIPPDPLYYGIAEHDENHALRVRLAAKRNYGNFENPPRTDTPRPAPPSSTPPKDDEDDGIFT